MTAIHSFLQLIATGGVFAEAEAEAEAYCRQPAGTLTPGIGTHGHIFVQCQDLCFVFPFVDPPY
jgi:hypothetical protein